jgi:hypothetical protein
MAIPKPDEPMLRILEAQQANIARIETDLVVPGTTGDGSQIRLWGPRPDVIRLYDTPLAFVQAGVLQNWDAIISLMPLQDSSREQIINRNDRGFRYMVQFLVRLQDSEIGTDRAQAVVDGVKADNPLAAKAHRLVYDWHHVFHDNIHLETDECPQGLVDHAEYDMTWEPGVEYPMALFTAEVTGHRSAW